MSLLTGVQTVTQPTAIEYEEVPPKVDEFVARA
jgi:hypothetical protein